MSVKNNFLIGQKLIDEGVITAQQLEAGLREQKKPVILSALCFLN